MITGESDQSQSNPNPIQIRAAGYNHTKAPKAAAAGARVKQAQLCIDNFSTAGTDPSGNAVGTFSFNGKLYMCESWDVRSNGNGNNAFLIYYYT